MFELKRQNKNKKTIKHGELKKEPMPSVSVYDNIIRAKYYNRPIINKKRIIIYKKTNKTIKIRFEIFLTFIYITSNLQHPLTVIHLFMCGPLQYHLGKLTQIYLLIHDLVV